MIVSAMTSAIDFLQSNLANDDGRQRPFRCYGRAAEVRIREQRHKPTTEHAHRPDVSADFRFRL